MHGLTVLLLLLIAPSAAAQRIDAALAARIDSVFAIYDTRTSPGCALAVTRDGAIAYERGYGMADLEHDVPIGPESVFDIGSTAKQFAAMSILLLARDGKLSLDDDVRRHVPELPDYGHTIRIRHLLTHTSGLRDYIGLLTMAGARYDDVTTEDDALQAIVRQKALNFEPGAEYLYSNSGFFLLSTIVKRVSGSSLRDFARQRIFDPLGMTRTHYLGTYDDIVPGRAIGYSPRPGGGWRSDMPRWLQTGDGGVWSTVRELARWDENFYRPLIGDSALLADFQTTGSLTTGSAITYALGLRVDRYRGQRTVSHGGSWGGYRAELLRFPDRHVSIITLCNVSTSDPSALARRVADIYLADALAPATRAGRAARTPRAPTRAPIPLAEITGTYRQPSTGETIRVVAERDTAYLVMSRRYPLTPLGGSAFELGGPFDGTRVTIEPATRGQPRALVWQREGDAPQRYAAIEPLALAASALAPYAGTYFSEELQTAFVVAVAGDSLELRARNRPPVPLHPSIVDEFTAPGGTTVLRFERGPSGTATAFTLAIGRVRGLRFERRP